VNTQIQETNLRAGLRVALWLEAVTIAWMIVEAAASIGAGLLARSLLLVAFGVDSGIELLSAGVLYRRLIQEARAKPGDEAAIARLERRTARSGGYLLYGLALYVLLQAAYGLWRRGAAETSWLGIGVAVVAALGMPVLARAKIRVAEQIGSRALRADAMETITCGYLSWVLLAGLAANALLHWWWLDSAAALVLVPFLIKEGREALTGECCGCEHAGSSGEHR
jgi:divalent metal cation (Fe/Co/Zn/Cd) transporter